jgi:hypothetical protein
MVLALLHALELARRTAKAAGLFLPLVALALLVPLLVVWVAGNQELFLWAMALLCSV